MKLFKNILFATDFSDASSPAAEYAITMAELTGAHLHVLHVINELDEHQRVMIPHEAFQLLQKEIELQTVRELDGFCKGQAAGISTTTHAVVGTAFQKILATGAKVNADLIVMGTHGRTGVEHVIVGSTAERVVRRSKIPVLTVRCKD